MKPEPAFPIVHRHHGADFDATPQPRQAVDAAAPNGHPRTVVEGLERSMHESQIRIDELRRFNQIVGHDLRGPLIGIGGVAELARRALDARQLEQAAALLDAICRQSQTSLEFLDRLLEASRAGHVTPRPVRTALGHLVEQSIERVMLGQPASGAVQWRIDALPDVEADPALLRQVLDNLIGNAVKFSAGRPEPTVTIRCELADARLTMHVEDNGVGFDAAHVNVFAPFRRGPDHGRVGFGLGLSIARAAAEAQGGRLWCHSAPGQGATFSFSVTVGEA